MNKVIKFLIKYAPKKRYYFAICLFILVLSFVRKTGPIYHDMNYFTYEYGLINPWVVVYHNYPMDMQRLYHMLTVSDMGAEWSLQYIFIDAGFIYIILMIANLIYKNGKKK
ncbi:hypothetical protein [Candidatus Galacturonibacter soehngenii]|uniref:Uncharacterized protein n=1 Tax=Candidatus Galacturonatibacter soehngenii TaxID=2307010 RepID=A0A7V7QK32_9FIRM|nr:hypothetical protein [Candidatus Galacturonibacter soehngenii]KAB1438085.1 hypothetical protein F7O84_11030 [Candidatus Galacturonibacter soehngenii]MBA4687135.1 hypothetical protein [Candidatus Galacturonibacter soehngenii]